MAIGATTTEAIDYRKGNKTMRVHKLAGITKYGTVSLKCGVTDSRGLFDLASAMSVEPMPPGGSSMTLGCAATYCPNRMRSATSL